MVYSQLEGVDDFSSCFGWRELLLERHPGFERPKEERALAPSFSPSTLTQLNSTLTFLSFLSFSF